MREGKAMKTGIGTVLNCLVVAGLFAGFAGPVPARADDPVAAKATGIDTLDEALQQLKLYPRDAYLQYVALQLARRENRLDEIARRIDEFRGNGCPNGPAGRRDQVDLFSIFTGALAVQESLQLDTMRDGAPRRNRPMQPQPGSADAGSSDARARE